MKKASSKIKSYAQNINIVDNSHTRRKVLHFIFISMGFLAFLYVLLLGNMVWNIVERKAMEKKSYALASEIGVLELDYLALSSKVDVKLSYEMGFKEIKPNFATRKPIGMHSIDTVALLANEI